MVKSEPGELTDQQATEGKEPMEAIIMKWLLTVVGVVMLLGTSIYSVAIGHQIASIGQIVGGLAVLAFANLNRIAKFKVSGTGFEAEMEKARAITKEAKGAIDELRELGLLIADMSLSLTNRLGRWGTTYTDEEKDAVRKNVISILNQLGVQEQKIQNLLSESHAWVDFDYTFAILGGNEIPQIPSFDLREACVAERRALLARGIANPPTPEELRDYLSKNQMLSREREKFIEDYDYYRQHRKHRRPDAWLNRGQLSQLMVQPNGAQSQSVLPGGNQ
jgi:hypothetical protein